MHGLFGSIGQGVTWDFTSLSANHLVQREHTEKSFHLYQFTLPKFLNDKYFYEEDGCFLATEGVLFEADSPAQAITRYRRGETTFWDSWRGSFCGVLYDKKANILLLFNDHIGSKMLFYSHTADGFVFASDNRLLAKTISAKEYNKQFIQVLYP